MRSRTQDRTVQLCLWRSNKQKKNSGKGTIGAKFRGSEICGLRSAGHWSIAKPGWCRGARAKLNRDYKLIMMILLAPLFRVWRRRCLTSRAIGCQSRGRWMDGFVSYFFFQKLERLWSSWNGAGGECLIGGRSVWRVGMIQTEIKERFTGHVLRSISGGVWSMIDASCYLIQQTYYISKTAMYC